jgi:hypothetical protein
MPGQPPPLPNTHMCPTPASHPLWPSCGAPSVLSRRPTTECWRVSAHRTRSSWLASGLVGGGGRSKGAGLLREGAKGGGGSGDSTGSSWSASGWRVLWGGQNRGVTLRCGSTPRPRATPAACPPLRRSPTDPRDARWGPASWALMLNASGSLEPGGTKGWRGAGGGGAGFAARGWGCPRGKRARRGRGGRAGARRRRLAGHRECARARWSRSARAPAAAVLLPRAFVMAPLLCAPCVWRRGWRRWRRRAEQGGRGPWTGAARCVGARRRPEPGRAAAWPAAWRRVGLLAPLQPFRAKAGARRPRCGPAPAKGAFRPRGTALVAVGALKRKGGRLWNALSACAARCHGLGGRVRRGGARRPRVEAPPLHPSPLGARPRTPALPAPLHANTAE